jgi:hypothetical protein
MKPYFLTPLTSLADCEGFFFCLEQDNLLFHPEDDPANVINANGRVFTDQEANAIRQRVSEAYEFMDDPCNFILTLSSFNTDRL